MRVEVGHEVAPVDYQEPAIGMGDGVGRPLPAVEQRHLAEGLACPDHVEDDLSSFLGRCADADLALQHRHQAVAGRALGEDRGAGGVLDDARKSQQPVELGRGELIEQKLPAREKLGPMLPIAGHFRITRVMAQRGIVSSAGR